MNIYTVIDLETTGLDHKKDVITEIAALRIREDGRELGSFNTFVEQNVEVSDFITGLTGITTEDVRRPNAIPEMQALGTLSAFCNESIVIAQFAPFDFSFLSEHGFAPKDFVCTRALSKLVEPNEKSGLKHVCERHNINLNGHHRAMNDVLATWEVFKLQSAKAKEQAIDYRNVVIDSEERPLRYTPLHAKIIKQD